MSTYKLSIQVSINPIIILDFYYELIEMEPEEEARSQIQKDLYRTKPKDMSKVKYSQTYR